MYIPVLNENCEIYIVYNKIFVSKKYYSCDDSSIKVKASQH